MFKFLYIMQNWAECIVSDSTETAMLPEHAKDKAHATYRNLQSFQNSISAKT